MLNIVNKLKDAAVAPAIKDKKHPFDVYGHLL